MRGVVAKRKSPEKDAPPTEVDTPAQGETDDIGKGKNSLQVGMGARLRAYFLAGILVTAPFAVTLYLAWVLVSFVDSRVTPLIPAKYNPETYLPFSLPGLGLVVLIVALTLVGSMTAGLVGRIFIRTSERVLNRMPIIRSVYGAAKQIFETVLAQQSNAFREVALFEYPRPGCWAIGFVTNYQQGGIERYIEDDLVSIMLPTTPNPTSGYLLFVPKRDIIILDMTIEEAMKLVISGGIVLPDHQVRRLREERRKPDAA
ncbi:MAG: DUF502 domain-containing protein [Alphaproteobacteria bacterium]|nr:DUF502 domain-containing protein [Alphaproteobacteria bacterium]